MVIEVAHACCSSHGGQECLYCPRRPSFAWERGTSVNLGDQGLNQPSGKLAVPTVPSFDAFHDRHQMEWMRYAHVHTGSREAAEQIVDALTAHLAEYWPSLERGEKAAQHSWKVLKATVARWLGEHGTGSAFIETAVFDRVARVLAQSRDSFAAMEESLGL